MRGITGYSALLQNHVYSGNYRSGKTGRDNAAKQTTAKATGSDVAKQTTANRTASGNNTAASSRIDQGKPVWDSHQVFNYIEDMGSAGIAYGEKAKKYYVSQTMQDGELSIDELKKQIQEWFPDYTLTDREPRKVVNGKHYLYIDNSQLAQMAKDSEYRGRVYGLMDREMETGRSYTMKYSDGRNVTSHITGSIFSLCEKNRKYDCGDGIPYLGSGMSDHPFSSSDSHPMVRSMSYLRDNLDPAKSAAKSRATLAAKKASEKAKVKKAAEKTQTKKAAEKAQAKKVAEKLQAKKQVAKVSAKKQTSMNMQRKRTEQLLKQYYTQTTMQGIMGSGRRGRGSDWKA